MDCPGGEGGQLIPLGGWSERAGGAHLYLNGG
jgi:hypothetical protein